MKVPYLDLPQQYRKQKKELDVVFKRVMNEGSFILRKDVELFEKNIAKYLKVKHVIGVNSGTDALYLSLKSLNLKKGDEVITTALLPYSTFAILNAGATPVFVDIKGDFNMDVGKMLMAITPKTKAIIAVSLNGRACKIDKIRKIARSKKIVVIEDAAQSFGSKYKGKSVGTFGLLGCFSLHPMKNLSCAGDGGFIVTNNNRLAKKLRALRNLGKLTKTTFSDFGYNSRLDNLQAAILNVKLKNINKYIQRRREIALAYNRGLAGIQLILPEYPSKDYYDTYNSYVIYTGYRNELFAYLKKYGIEAFIHYTAPSYEIKGLNLKASNLTLTKLACKDALSLPINPSMTNQQVNYVIKTIKNFSIWQKK
jgi:dTDP-4-amino-4,6-dideoxygalactose transaminase